MGEGMMRISSETRKKGNYKSKNYGSERKKYYRHIVKITLRQDDEQILDWIQKEIGGHIFRRGIRNKVYNKLTGGFTFSNPTTIWQAEDLDTCELVAKLIINCPIPSKKKKEAKVFLEYIKLKRNSLNPGKGYFIDISDKFEIFHQEMKNLKQYK